MGRLRFFLGITGILVAAAIFVWLLAGWLEWMPSMVDMFGVAGMRTPAVIAVAGLLLAAIAFWEY